MQINNKLYSNVTKTKSNENKLQVLFNQSIEKYTLVTMYL